MTPPQIPLAIPNLCGNEKKYLERCIASNFVSYVGPFVTQLEEITAKASGAKFGVATSSGTTGLHLALVSMGIGKDDLVIIPSLTFVATANAVKHCGADPVLLDVSKASWTLDPESLEDFLMKNTYRKNGKIFYSKTKQRLAAVMPVYTLGVPADMDAICRVARSFGLPVVADGAAALGATYKGRPVGALADLTVFSFNGNKTVTAGGGGVIVGNDPKSMNLAKHLSTTARLNGLEYRHDRVGYNYRMTNVQAAVGCAQMEKLGPFVAKKRKINQIYDKAFSGVGGVSLFPKPRWAKSACWISGIVLEDKSLPDVLTVCRALKEEGIEAKPFWQPVHLQVPYLKAVRAPLGATEKIWSKILTLPSSTQLTPSEQSKVIRCLKQLLKKEKSR
ncbi:MAG: aminotransferase class I/II-fold pyridoxal phosphate-dependent enzyme [Candidatus Omnitrophica bacterium]|nr:aminotransferase class I/II-fold pyridoxal phosphate-dependent enzyme [Candidatus Omnitrophota bacterium]